MEGRVERGMEWRGGQGMAWLTKTQRRHSVGLRLVSKISWVSLHPHMAARLPASSALPCPLFALATHRGPPVRFSPSRPTGSPRPDPFSGAFAAAADTVHALALAPLAFARRHARRHANPPPDASHCAGHPPPPGPRPARCPPTDA